MHILIADDERPARAELRYLLEELASNASFGEARNGKEVLDYLATNVVDVLFLDINMPSLNGLATAALILEKPHPPFIIFATAYDTHAVRAFELAALDYVVKPFSEQRLAQTMLRIRQALGRQDLQEEQQRAIHTYLQQAQPGRSIAKLWAEQENKTALLVDYSQILWIAAEDKRVFVQTVDGKRLALNQTLKELEPRLAPHGILRIHKAYLANLDYIGEVIPWFSGTYLLRMKDAAQSELPMSRQYARALKERFV